MTQRTTPEILSSPAGISSLKPVTLGNATQWILIRGEDRENPILLFLHGGPGNVQIGWAAEFNHCWKSISSSFSDKRTDLV